MGQPTYLLLLLSLLAAITPAQAAKEAWYQKVWCDGAGGKMEVELPEGPRVDCITDNHAIEMDFAHKWTEAIGQSLHYALLTEKKAGIVLILKTPGDLPHLEAARKVINTYQLPIQIWPLGP